MHEGAPKQPQKNEKEPNLSRRAFLGAGAALVAAALLRNDSREKGDDRIVEDSIPFPTPEKIDELKSAREKILGCIGKMRNSPYMEKPLRAKQKVEHTEITPDLKSIVLAVEVDEIIKSLHIKDVTELSRRLHAGGGNGVYVHHEHGEKFHITLEDSSLDIGVSNRFSVRKHIHKDGFSELLPVYAVKRARYEKRQVVKEVVDKKGKKKKEKSFEGEYKEYVTYTPPASHLVTNEVIASGKEYIDVVLDAAHSVLSHRMIKSNQNILALCRDICKRLAVIEHVDPKALATAEKKATGETEDQVEKRKGKLYQKMYAEYGLNQDIAFNHLVNFVGAGGMMQIIRKTYTNIRERLIVRKVFLPHEIPEDVNVGRKDPLISAIIALYLCYDNYLLKGKFLGTKRNDEIELSLVSMYNGSPNLYEQIVNGTGVKRHKKEVDKKGSSAEIPSQQYKNSTPLIHKILTHNHGERLPGTGEPENRNYVRKYLQLKLSEKNLI